VSLWQVADESTAQFMIAVYKLVEAGMSYSDAITTVKRRFIAGEFGEDWKAPYYWSPFVYYGRS
jgi:CHAT domain-containing protein